MMEDRIYPYLSSREFSELSDEERSNYYDSLAKQASEAYTAEQKMDLANAYAALDGYGDAARIADEMRLEAEAQKQSDDEYNMRKFKKGFIVIGAICAGLVAIAAIATVILLAL